MKTYIHVAVTRFYDTPQCDYGYMYISIDGTLEQHVRLSAPEAEKQLLLVCKKLKKAPQLRNNSINPMISTRSIYGFCD